MKGKGGVGVGVGVGAVVVIAIGGVVLWQASKEPLGHAGIVARMGIIKKQHW
jgi:hypothetical protein